MYYISYINNDNVSTVAAICLRRT